MPVDVDQTMSDQESARDDRCHERPRTATLLVSVGEIAESPQRCHHGRDEESEEREKADDTELGEDLEREAVRVARVVTRHLILRNVIPIATEPDAEHPMIANHADRGLPDRD